MGLDRADPEVGADGGHAVALAQAGAGGPAVGELGLLVGQGELFALVLLGLDAADLLGRGDVVEQRHEQVAHRLQAVGGELVAQAGGEQPALAGVEDHGLAGLRAVADAGHELAHAHQHAGEPLDALAGDLAARVGGELELVSATRASVPAGSAGERVVTSKRAGESESGRRGVGGAWSSFRRRVEWAPGDRPGVGGDGVAQALARGGRGAPATGEVRWRAGELDAVRVDAQVEVRRSATAAAR